MRSLSFLAKISSFLKSFDCVNIVNSLNSVYRFQIILVFYVSLLFCAKMVFGAKCCCSHHNTWHHGEVSPKLLRAVNSKELEFCDVARAKNKNRSRWVCPPCRDRIALELKCRMYEVRSEVYIIIVVISPKRRFARSVIFFF